ncbi:MAG: 5'/3'-nucleotidase SurE [Desulfuromonadales bacterium]|nr:5'/3'-nucleotidase SurE [Desulfuromonadales bacterium]
MLILVTNDDGIHSPGLRVLTQALKALGQVVVVAPDRERSAISHALTLHSPLRATEHAADWWAVDGTPTDCVNLGIHGLLKAAPDLVVSGINQGANLGDDLTYSGTVAAAMEATLMGVPAVAVSLAADRFAEADFLFGGRWATKLATMVKTHGLPADTFLNVNVPPGRPHGMKLTRQGKRRYADAVVRNTDPRGRNYYWIGAGELSFHDLEGTDVHAVERGWVSVTPLHLDLTNYAAFERLRHWDAETVHSEADDTNERPR